MRKSIIHNDGNDHNIILNKDGNLKGIIDFGDIIHSFTALDAAVCMVHIKKIKKPLESMKRLLEGYQSIFPLYEDDFLARSNDLFKTVSISYNVCLEKNYFPIKYIPDNI